MRGEDRSPWGGDSPLADAIRQGWITPPTAAGSPLPPRTPIAPLNELLRELAEDRDDSAVARDLDFPIAEI